MQNFSAQTGLPPAEILERADRYFVETCRLVLIARVMHLHGAEGAVQIEVAGSRLAGNGSHDARQAFEEIVAHVQEKYGLTPIYTLLHLHAEHEDDSGHLLVQFDYSTPGLVQVETQDYVRQANDFLSRMLV